jgi:nocturnin
MGSFTAIPKAKGEANTDDDLDFPPTSAEELLARCSAQLSGLPPPFKRRLRTTGKGQAARVRLLQWNQLSQTLGSQNDGFLLCPPVALDWSCRRWRLLEELVRHSPDILCLQEVDHFPLLERALASLGYSGHFVPKPDSPCIYLPNNSGPDGCSVFYRAEQWQVVGEVRSRVLEVWHVQSNQVVLAVNLRHRGTGREVCVATTHLKARSGALLATLRHEQGKDLLDWLETVRQDRPLVLTGDFNAEPSEPVIRAVTEQLESAYKTDDTDYTTWKVREQGGEQKNTLDCIFHSKGVEVTATLDMPTEEQVGAERLPSLAFPSDHLSLVADFLLL